MKVTYNGAVVLQALAKGLRYGFEIMDATGLPSGTVYPILRRFEHGSLVRSRWESPKQAHGNGHPRRRYYELTEAGRGKLGEAAARFEAHQKLFAAEPL